MHRTHSALNLTAAEHTRGIAVDEQRKHGCWRVLRVTGAPIVDLRAAQFQQAHRVEDEVHQMVDWHPVAHVQRHQQQRLTANVHKAGGHPPTSPSSSRPGKVRQAASHTSESG